jgi:pyruvate carboxylase subunit B
MAAIPHTPLRQLWLDGRPHTLVVMWEGERWVVELGGERWTVLVEDERTRELRTRTGRAARRPGAAVIRAPMPGLVVRVQVERGQRLEAGAGVVVLEAMKMENEISAPGPGVVRKIHVAPGQAVEKGAALLEMGDQG